MKISIEIVILGACAGTVARRAKSAPADIKKTQQNKPMNKGWDYFHCSWYWCCAVLVGVLCPDLVPKIQERCKKIVVNSERGSENN